MVGRQVPMPVALTDGDGDFIGGWNSVVDSAGNPITPDNYAHTLTYNGDGTLATDSFNDGTYTWTQTFTYTNGNLTGVSKWVKS